MSLSAPAFEQQALRTFELINRSPSAYVKKGTERWSNPDVLNSPKFKMLTVRSYYCLGDGKGYTQTQYVIGAPTIFMEDLYRDENDQLHSMSEKQQTGWKMELGLKSLKYDLAFEYRRSIAKNLGFEFGILSLDKYGDDPTLIEYVKNHEDNIEAPNAQYNKRGKSNIWNFRCINQNKKAAAKLDTLDTETDMLNFISSMRTRQKDDSYTYTEGNRNAIDAVMRLYDMVGGPDMGYNEKLLAIKGVASQDPVKFMMLTDSALEDIRMEIATGVTMKILELGKDAYLITGDKGTKNNKRKLCGLENDDVKMHPDEVAFYFLTTGGAIDYRDFTLLLEAAKQVTKS